MPTSFRDNTSDTKAKVKVQLSAGMRRLLNGIHETANPKTPKEFGDLRRNVLKQVLGLTGIIQWRQKYALPQEEKQFVNYTTPGTGPHFARDAVRSEVKKPHKYFGRLR